MFEQNQNLKYQNNENEIPKGSLQSIFSVAIHIKCKCTYSICK